MWRSVLLSAAVLLCGQGALCEKKVLCDLGDSDCLTEGAKRLTTKYLKDEIPELPIIDPLHFELLQGKLPTLKFSLRNATLYGMTSCTPELLKVHGDTSDFKTACKHLTMEADYEIQGELFSFTVDGKGACKVDFYDYVFLFTFEFDTVIEGDEQLYIKLKNYSVEMEARGRVEYQVPDLYNGDAQKSAEIVKYMNENWRLTDNTLRGPVMTEFMKSYVNVLVTYFSRYPLAEEFYKT